MSRFSHRQLLLLLKNARENVLIGQYKHIKSGISYDVMGIALEEKTVTPVVVYSDANNIIWTRDLEDFNNKFNLTKRHD